MPGATVIPVRCEPGTLDDLARHFRGYAPLAADPAWLTSGLWLFTRTNAYLATASVHVLDDGTVTRSPHIDRPDAFLRSLSGELAEVQSRIEARGRPDRLPPVPEGLEPPRPTTDWNDRDYELYVVLCAIERGPNVHRIGRGLLFAGAGRLLVATDPSTLALLISSDDDTIEHHLAGCETIAAADYRPPD